MNINRNTLLVFLLLSCTLMLGACTERVSLHDGVVAGGVLRIATVAGNTTFRRSANGYSGFEHDLAVAYAKWLGVKPRFIVARNYAHLRKLVSSGRAHLGAALVPVDGQHQNGIRYGPSYAAGEQLIIHRRDRPRPRSPTDLLSWRGGTIDGRGAVHLLKNELPSAAGFQWAARPDLAISELLRQVDEGELDYAVLPSFDFEVRRRFYPELRVGFELGAPQAVAWIYRNNADDNSFGDAQVAFFRDFRSSGEFTKVEQRYFGHVDDFDYVESRAFMRHYSERLPQYREIFETVARNYDLDWRLLAAISYQESHWRNDARSPTGVRGLMMLTNSTAKQLGVDRLDPAESIDGGARYLLRMKKRLPERITDPDRTLLALAAYNIGLGHLEDARKFTAKGSADPDRWQAVQVYLPKLGDRKWAEQARYGSARGYQAVHFVTNVQRYYALLRWLESPELAVDSQLHASSDELINPAL